MFKRTLLAVSLSVIAAACATSSAGSGARPTRGASRDVIGREELSQSTASNALDAIRQLRPQFLQSRGAVTIGMGGSSTSNEPTVYLDEQRLGGLRELSAITISDIEEIRYLSASDATQRFGTGNASGAIVIKRRRAGPA